MVFQGHSSRLANGPPMARTLPCDEKRTRPSLRIIAWSWALVVERVTRIELALSAWEPNQNVR
jgi:hypothetical protein